MIDVSKAKVGDVVWIEVYGSVTKGVISSIDYTHYSYRDRYWVEIQIGTRHTGSSEGTDWYHTRQEAVTAAWQWLQPKLAKSRARTYRLERMEAALQQEATDWTPTNFKGGWHRYQLGPGGGVVASVRGTRKIVWRVNGISTGVAATVEEAKIAADKVLIDQEWTLK